MLGRKKPARWSTDRGYRGRKTVVDIRGKLGEGRCQETWMTRELIVEEDHVKKPMPAANGTDEGIREDREQRRMLMEALSCDFVLTASQVEALCRTEAPGGFAGRAEDPARTCTLLLPCLLEADQLRKAMFLTHSLGDVLRIESPVISPT